MFKVFVGSNSYTSELCLNFDYRGTVCLNWTRTDLWGSRLGNHRFYPEPDAGYFASFVVHCVGLFSFFSQFTGTHPALVSLALALQNIWD